MMTTDTRPVVHEPWCRDHQQDLPESPGFCCRESSAGPAVVNVDADDNGPQVRLWVQGEPELTPEQARATAAALVEAAGIVEQAAK